jgi:hypothetical protein
VRLRLSHATHTKENIWTLWRSLAFILTSICLLLTGCGFYSAVRLTVNDHITEADVGFIQRGKTTLTEVVAKLGAPDELTGHDRGVVLTYHFRDAKYSRVNLGWPLRFWLPVQPDMIFAGGALGTDMFQIAFDQQWVAQYHAFAKHVQGVHHRLWPF